MRRSKQRKTARQRKNSCKYRLNRFEKYRLISQLSVVIQRKFPELYDELSKLPDYRKKPRYEVRELIVSGLLMFLFRQKSRNQADNKSKNLDYQDNVKKFFGIKVADMDTVDRYLRFLNPDYLETIKQDMFREIIRSKVLQKYRYQGKYYQLAIDGSGLQSYDYEPYPGCPFKEYKSGKKVWTTYILEAKIVTTSGFALSLASEWIENPTNESFDKQDSENKAFKRLSAKLKRNFPRLPLMLLLDGLYPNSPVFEICKTNNWAAIITLKDKSLKSVQEQIADMLLFNQYKQTSHVDKQGAWWHKNDYKVFQNVEYQKYTLHVIETLFEKKHEKTNELEKTRFVHISNIEISEKSAHKLSLAGRLRWKIENEGFNNQKNSDYNAEHKYSRTNFNATKNYYQLLQIADMINQFVYKQQWIQKFIIKHELTLMAVIELIMSYLKVYEFDDEKLINTLLSQKVQLRY